MTLIQRPLSDSERRALKYRAWQTGQIQYLLHDGQMELERAWNATSERIVIFNISRQFGKTFWCVNKTLSYGLSKPGWKLKFGAPTKEQAEEIVAPIIDTHLEDCPKDFLPRFDKSKATWVFKNGARFKLFGNDDKRKANRGRGTGCNFGILDEGAFNDVLEYALTSVLLPQTITTNGRIIIPSTPPESPSHPFVRLATEAEAMGAYVHKTIYENPMATPELIAEYMRLCGGAHTSTWKREYLAQFVVDEESAVIPEFEDAEKDVVVEHKRPEFFDTYVALDVGFLDLSVAIFGYYDFMAAKIVIEDEMVMKKMTTEDLAKGVKAKELALWGKEGERKPPLRTVDAPLIVTSDISRLHGVHFVPARKDDSEAAINALRLCVKNRQVIIHPRCKTLIAHLRHAVWNKSRTTFQRSGDFGHFDGVDALKYFVRVVNRQKNPYPVHAAGVTPYTHHIRDWNIRKRGTEETIRNLFKKRPR